MRSRDGVLVFLILVGAAVFVGAVTPVWDPGSFASPYWASEDSQYLHNFTINVTNYVSSMTFEILTSKNITWNGVDMDYSQIQNWIFIASSNDGVLTLNATNDSRTGNFSFHVLARDGASSSGEDFTFIINATNDVPVFSDLNYSYNFSQGTQGSHVVNAIDEEGHPLNFNLTWINNCTHASWSGRNPGENCSIFNLSYGSATSSVFNFTPVYDDVGTYWANFNVIDFNATCPHSYCDSSYTDNKSSGNYIIRFNVYSSLSVDVSNCSGISVMEGETFNCTINVTTRGEDDALNFSSYGFFSSNPVMPYDSNNRDWFYGAASDSASNFFYSLPISVTPAKNEVGNWTINFSVVDVAVPNTVVGQIKIFVNYTESGVSLDPISDMAIYENGNFTVNAYDNDLLIWDTSVKDEVLTFVSNESWVVPGSGVVVSGNNYSSSFVFVNHSEILSSSGVGNYSVMINVSDVVGNVDSTVFVVEILNDSAPVWNVSLSSPVVLNLTEDVPFFYNVSLNVSDPGEVISFYYKNISGSFCSINSSNFNSSSGIIDFAPKDCDVGFHNVSIVAGNGKLNSSWSFVFNISNVADPPSIFFIEGDNGTGYDLNPGFNFIAPEGLDSNFSLVVDDDDFLIPLAQRSYYNESIFVNMTFTNSTGGLVDLFNFSFFRFASPNPESVSYNATFTPGVADVGNYVVFVHIVDALGNSTNRTWNLNITESLEPPVLQNVSNVSLTIHDNLSFDLNATDNEDDFNGLNLSYFVVGLNGGAPNLTVSGNRVEFNMSSNQSYAGKWGYNVSVVDNDSMEDSQIFYLSVYGFPSLVLPIENYSFAGLVENSSSVLNFTVNHLVWDNLTYEFWVDNVSCSFQNNSNCSYGNFTFRELFSGVGNGSVFGWDFLPSFNDESYGLLKNLTVTVYPNSSLLSLNQSRSVASNFSFRLNISHANAPMRAVAPIGLLQGIVASYIDVDLSSYFVDEDARDPYWSQNVSFSKESGDSRISVTHLGGWDIRFRDESGLGAYTGFVNVLGEDDLNTSDVIEDIEVKFVAPTTTRSSSSSKTVVKFYSIRIIVPDDVIISDENYIDVPFALENSGTIDLRGINLGSSVLYNNQFSDDVKINLGTSYVDELKVGEKRDYTMRILADTDRSGRYKATLFANITSPKFSDWGDFFIDLRRTNESESEKLLIFTEKIISDNPECLELTEVFRRAQEALEAGDEAEAIRLAQEVSAACEDAIIANEQIRYNLEGFAERNFYYISFITLVIFFIGFIFYVYKRVRFNKSVEDEYISSQVKKEVKMDGE